MIDDQRETLTDLLATFRQCVAMTLDRVGDIDEDGAVDDDPLAVVRGFIGQLEDMITPGGVDRALWERELEDVDT